LALPVFLNRKKHLGFLFKNNKVRLVTVIEVIEKKKLFDFQELQQTLSLQIENTLKYGSFSFFKFIIFQTPNQDFELLITTILAGMSGF
jgi:hypothetical protein